MIVLDASAAIELVLQTTRGRAIADEIASPEVSLHAPHLIDAEVALVLRRQEQRGEIPGERAWSALTDFAALDVFRYPHPLLLARVWELRHTTTAYDALYLALAELLDARLVTTDARLGRGSGSAARVDVIRPR